MKNSIIISFFFCLQIFSQEIEFVDAPNGLVIRDAPSLNSNKIGKLSYSSRVLIIDRTGVKLEINDEGKLVSGEWNEVKDLTNNLAGFVFNGFLTKKALDKGSESNGYYITKIDSKEIMKYEENIANSVEQEPLSFFLRDNTHKNLSKFPISDVLLYDGSKIYLRDIKGLENIKKLIVIESTFSACCSSSDEFYFLIDSKDNLIELPKVDNTHCDGPEPFFGYVFPEDKNGKEKKIIFGKIIPNEKYENEKIEILKTYSWDGSHMTVEK